MDGIFPCRKAGNQCAFYVTFHSISLTPDIYTIELRVIVPVVSKLYCVDVCVFLCKTVKLEN